MLIAMLLIGMAIVPSVSAEEMETNQTQNIDGLQPSVESHIYYVKDDGQFSRQHTKEEYYAENQEYFKFLSEEMGEDIAYKILDREYEESKIIPPGIREGMNALNTDESGYQIVQVRDDPVFMWPYNNHHPTPNGIVGCINVIFYNKDRSEFAYDLKKTAGWEGTTGSPEWSGRGESLSNFEWTQASPLDRNAHIQDGDFYRDRYHLILFDGYPSQDLDWCYGNCHYEKWDGDQITHVAYPNCLNDGRDHLVDAVENKLDWSSSGTVDLSNSWSGMFNGRAALIELR
ncbi:hypothetical protein [Methanofollis aquaemaris]|nr:hypothetical protein [Methanofollis aquaemaris]